MTAGECAANGDRGPGQEADSSAPSARTARDRRGPSRSIAPAGGARVLHIGNIANNAYLNSKILNAAGFDCDVICYDYEHIMGCPEWEDSDFRGDYKDEFRPQWHGVDFRGYRRPRWFIQGPWHVCVAYLLARRDDRRLAARFHWIRAQVVRMPFFNLLIDGGRALVRRARDVVRKSAFAIANAILSLPVINRYSSVIKDHYRRSAYGPPLGSAVSGPHAEVAPSEHIAFLIDAFAEAFPDREDKLGLTDIAPYLLRLPKWSKLFSRYDVIHAYATDPIWPMLAGKHPYVAYEHSTIRHLPFQNSPIGRLTALAYHLADEVIITNCDTYAAADRLRVRRYRFIPHPVNEDWLDRIDGTLLRPSIADRLNADFVVINPSRQHWWPHRDDGWKHSGLDPAWLKGNDILIEALGRFRREVSPRMGAVFVEWGQSVEDSKKLIAAEGLSDSVIWIRPQNCPSLLRYISACDLLVDQFVVGAFGTTMPKAMQLGVAAMCYVSAEDHAWCLPELPVVVNVRTVDQVFDALKRAFEDREWISAIARDGRRWYFQYHSNERIGSDLAGVYRRVLAECRQQPHDRARERARPSDLGRL